ncbi:hypothetical protein [Ilumatobacter fluminis]|nr:hypothetical protein [Ilumatobacter fluminis]
MAARRWIEPAPTGTLDGAPAGAPGDAAVRAGAGAAAAARR